MENMQDRIFPKLLSIPATATGTVTSSACDTEGYEGVAFTVLYGNSGDVLSGSLCWTAKLQSCATEGGSYTDVATADILIGTTNSFGLVDAPTEDSEVYWLGYNGTNRYVKVVVTATGTHATGTPIAILALLGMPRTQSEDGKVNP